MKQSIARRNSTLYNLLSVVDADPAGIAFIVDENDVLIGVFTDGDIRRLLLNGYNLDSSLADITLKSFVAAKKGESVDSILAKASKKVRVIPIVDDNGVLVDYIRYDQRMRIPIAAPDLKGNELKYLTDAFLSTWISSAGAYIDQFEKSFAEYCDVEHGVATSNGTTAIHLAFLALGIGEGDEVIVPDFTFAASINAVLHAGATPVIVDVEKDTWCIDPKAIEQAITPKTKAILPVHIYGQPCSMDEIMQLAKAHDLFVIEDCAEAHGAEYKGKRVGSFGDISTFSFFANKIITTGEGGMCITNSAELRDKMRVLRDHGMNKNKRYWHDVVGFNYRMTNIQAAMGCAQLERIDSIFNYREQLEQEYRNIFAGVDGARFQNKLEDRKKAVWLVSLLMESVAAKKELQSFFTSHDIDIRPFFYPLSDMPIYQSYATNILADSNSKLISELGISLPTHKDVNLKRFAEVMYQYQASKQAVVG